MEQGKKFISMWTFIGWTDISLGFHINLGHTYLDLHVPFGWIRIGWENYPKHLIAKRNKQYGRTRN